MLSQTASHGQTGKTNKKCFLQYLLNFHAILLGDERKGVKSKDHPDCRNYIQSSPHCSTFPVTLFPIFILIIINIALLDCCHNNCQACIRRPNQPVGGSTVEPDQPSLHVWQHQSKWSRQTKVGNFAQGREASLFFFFLCLCPKNTNSQTERQTNKQNTNMTSH